VTAASWRDGSDTLQHTSIHSLEQPWKCGLSNPLFITRQGANIYSYQTEQLARRRAEPQEEKTSATVTRGAAAHERRSAHN